MKFDRRAVEQLMAEIQIFGFSAITVTKKGIECVPMERTIRLAKKAEPILKEKIGTTKQRERWKLYHPVMKPKG